jgi:hypothetical protein
VEARTDDGVPAPARTFCIRWRGMAKKTKLKYRHRTRHRQCIKGITDTGEKDKTWRTVRITDKNGSETDVRVSDNFEQLSPREQAQRVDEFIGLVRSPTDKLFTYSFWAMLIAPPVAAGILLFLIAWGLSGFRARAST